jgi:hypothetical protein
LLFLEGRGVRRKRRNCLLNWSNLANAACLWAVLAGLLFLLRPVVPQF